MESNQELASLKAAAEQMCGFFKSKGVVLKHAHMLEALSTGLGAANWRTLRAKFNGPAVPRRISRPALGVNQEWSVSGIYTDNSQQYCDNFHGRTPLEAAVNALMDRLSDFGLSIQVISVKDSTGEVALSPSFLTEIELTSNRKSLQALHRAAELSVCTDPLQADCRSWLGRVLERLAPGDDLEDLSDYGNLLVVPDKPRIVGPQLALPPASALQALCCLVEDSAGGIASLEDSDREAAMACYQVRALGEWFGPLLNNPECSVLFED